MPRIKRPLKGSRAFWPKKRAKRIYPRLKTWPEINEAKPVAFAGYKVGMTHVLAVDNNPNSKTKGKDVAEAVTVLDCPPLTVFGIKAYKKTFYGLKNVIDVLSEKIDKKLERKIKIPKKYSMEEKLKKLEEELSKISEIRLLVHTNPPFKKKPEVFEIPLGGNVEDQFKYATSILGKELKVSDIFSEGDYIDVSAVTKGKGFQGPVKRFGTKIFGRKYQQMQRHVAPLGPKEPGKTRSTVPAAGQLGFQTRTELNKRILKITNPDEVKVKGGFLHYGFPKGDVILVSGSLPGPAKRLIRIRHAIRAPKSKYPVTIKYISLESKQGV